MKENSTEGDHRLVWLAGVFDSGSSFFVGQTKDSNRGKERIRLLVRIDIRSVNPLLLREIGDILREHEIDFSIRKVPGVEEGRSKSAAAESLYIQDREEVLHFLLLVIPYLVVKRDKAEATILYLTRATLVRGYHPTEEDLHLLTPFFGESLIRKGNA